MKRQLYADAGLPIVETSEKAEKLMHESMTRPDFIEGITAFFEKRPPKFPPLTVQESCDCRIGQRQQSRRIERIHDHDDAGLPGD